MNNKTNLKHGTRIQFDINTIKGTGTIVGIATSGDVLLGKGYIVEPDEKISNEVYDYTHIVVYELYFTVLQDADNLCGCCGNQQKQELHACPRLMELDGDYESLCDCCESCESNCADDI